MIDVGCLWRCHQVNRVPGEVISVIDVGFLWRRHQVNRVPGEVISVIDVGFLWRRHQVNRVPGEVISVIDVGCLWRRHQVNRVPGEAGDGDDDMGNGTAGEEVEDTSIEYVVIEDDFYYLEPVMRTLALLHMVTAFLMVVGYYCLKVSVLTFFFFFFLVRAGLL